MICVFIPERVNDEFRDPSFVPELSAPPILGAPLIVMEGARRYPVTDDDGRRIVWYVFSETKRDIQPFALTMGELDVHVYRVKRWDNLIGDHESNETVFWIAQEAYRALDLDEPVFLLPKKDPHEDQR